MSELEDLLQDQARNHLPPSVPPFAVVRRRAARRRQVRGGATVAAAGVLTALAVGVPSWLAAGPSATVPGPAQGAPATPTATVTRGPVTASLFGPAPGYPGLPFVRGGDPVGRDELVVQSMPEHCDWQLADSLSGLALLEPDLPGADRYAQWVRDPRGVVSPALQQGFSPRAQLPPDAVDTGYRSGHVELWLAADRSAAYFVNATDPDDVERWPRADRAYLCA